MERNGILIMGSATKTKSHAGRHVFIFFLVFTILVAAIVIGMAKVFKNKDVTPSIAGYSLYIIDSDRMLDKVPRGSLVLASNETPSIEKVGKAVLCERVPGVGTSVFWLADVTAKEGEDGVVYTVYQEKNTSITYDIKSTNVVGEATTYYTWAGKVITFMISRFGMVICIGSPIALMIIIELIIAIASSDGYDEDDDDEDDEDDEIEKPSSIDDFLFSGDDATPIARDQLSDEDKEYINSDDSELSDEADEQEAEPIADMVNSIIADEAKKPVPVPDEDKQIKEEPKIVKLPEAEEEAGISPEGKTVNVSEAETPKAESKPDVKPAAAKPKRRKPETSLEDLVKLMEQQQQKLRDEMNKN